MCLLPIALATPAAPAAQQSAAGELASLESRLEREADSLQAANAYRRAVVRTGEYDRALEFFERLVTAQPHSANAHLNYAFACVDKIPAAGAVTQVILANSALTGFTKAIELERSWITLYARGASYLFWPKVFRRAPLGIADLEEALRLQRSQPKRSYYVRTFVTLGDGYWKADDPQRAREIWQEGLREFPDHQPLEQRLKADAAALAVIIDEAFDPSKRVDTDLSVLWSNR
jgi:tetratricopeptide (TPR) repeat protein